MNRFLILVALAGSLAVGACSFPFADDMQTRESWFDARQYNSVDDAIQSEMESRFGADKVFLSKYPEREFHRWVYEGPVRSVGLEKYRMRIEAYPKKDRDGWYMPLIIARQEVYNAQSMSNKRGAHKDFENTGYVEIGRDNKLEADIENCVLARLRKADRERNHYDDAKPMAAEKPADTKTGGGK
ncbi:MAG: hypothetical protein IT462_11050 [Planctomycetes bacterium]|nr:hypothetical protein [Planctomycetota bacterium]